MRKHLRKLVQTATERLYLATHRRPPPAFVRVAYSNPRQVVLITARSGDEIDVWPIDWHTPVSLEPDRYAVCLYHKGFGTELVRRAGCFVVHFVPASWEATILTCGNSSGRHADKFEEHGLKVRNGQRVDAPCIEGVLGRLECEVETAEKLGNRLLVIGRVVHSVLAKEGQQLYHVSTDAPEVREGS